MPLSIKEKSRVRALVEGRLVPQNGMEKHFVEVVSGQGRACTPKEKEWLAYWNSVNQSELHELEVDIVDPLTIDSGKEFQTPRKIGITDKIKSEVTEIEHRTDLSDDAKVSRITQIACATCAGVAIQPIPFADIFILTPIQAYFGTRIAAIRGVPVGDSEVIDLIKKLIGIIGTGFIAQQIAIGVWKAVTFGAGGLLTIPLVYGLTYAVMKVVDAYYSAKARNQTLSDKALKDLWQQSFREGKKKGKANDLRSDDTQ